MKRLLLAGMGVIGFCFSGFAQGYFDSNAIFAFYRPDTLVTADGESLVRDLPMQEFLDGRLPGSTLLGRMGTAPVANFSLAMVNPESRKKNSTAPSRVVDPKDGKDYSSTEAVALEKESLVWTGGEVGVYYGHASGKFGGDEFSSYILGSVGNEHMEINVGAGYEEFNGRVPRWRP